MLVALSISQWTARKHDRTVSDEVDHNHGAKDAGRYNKLLIDKEHLEPLAKLSGEIRTHHYAKTLPWGDNGERLLSSQLFFDYTRQMATYKNQFAALADTFVQNYPAMIQTARQRLGTMYEPRDYPLSSDIRNRFSIALSFTPVPSANDFRVDVGNEALEEIKASIEATNRQREQEAIKDTWRRVREVISKIQARTADPKAKIFDTLVENAAELVATLPGLNINDDPELTAIQKDIQDHLLVRPTILRNNPFARQRVADQAQSILDKFSWATSQ